MSPTRPVSLSWNEGRYFDLWMLVHLTGGVAGGFSNALFRLPTGGVLLLGFLLMLLWELVEIRLGVRESWENRLLDVALGLAGVAVALALSPRLGPSGRVAAFVVSVLVFAVGDLMGWLAYRRRMRQTGARAVSP